MVGNKSTFLQNETKRKHESLLKNQGVQTLISSLVCIVLGLIVGYIALLIINPAGAGKAIKVIMQNFMSASSRELQLKNLGNTLVKTAPLIMCSLSVLFAYKVGLFNIGAAGQYVAGAGLSLYCALALGMPWYLCLVAALLAGALLGVISGAMKAWLNVNEVISCIMLNWITLYCVNMLLVLVKNPTKAETLEIALTNPSALLPSLGLSSFFNNNAYVTIAIPLAVVAAVLIWVLLNKTKLGFELRATGSNKHAAKYAGMREKANMVLTMAIAGGLAGMGAGMFYLSGFEQWNPSMSAVPPMGFNGIAAAFLGGLNPIGAVFASYFIEHISAGGSIIDKSMYFSEISDLIAAVIIYLCGFVLFFRGIITRLNERVDEAGGWRTVLFSKRNLPKTIAIACCVLVIVTMGVLIMSQSGELEPLNAQVADLQSQIELDKKAVTVKENKTKQLQDDIVEEEANKAAVDAEVAAINLELDAVRAELEQVAAVKQAQAEQLEQIVGGLMSGEVDAQALSEQLTEIIDMLRNGATVSADEEEATAE